MGKEITYIVIGYDDNDNGFVASGLTAQGTHRFAEENNLKGFHRAPERGWMYPEANNGSFIRRQKDERVVYELTTLHGWLEDNYHFAKWK